MRKTFPVLALIAFACYFPCDVPVHADPVRKPEAAGRDDVYEHQKESHGEFNTNTETSERSLEDRDRSSELVGKWRSNGEALEPKWRDGDSVPLLPFSHYRYYPRDSIDDVEQEDFHETTRRPIKYRYSINQPNRPRSGLSRRLPFLEEYDYEVPYRGRENNNPEKDHPLKKRRPLKNSSTFYEEIIENAENNDAKRSRYAVGDSLNNDKEATSAKYREAFQARPNGYEHELSDEEYSRPRPRKRRPPQHYEFALANEASESEGEELKDSFQSQTQKTENENLSIMQSSDERTQKGGHRSGNAVELKSLLKMQQEEGSSLSEILQRRNLTLSDLLKGKTAVINALKSRISDESDEYIEEMSRVMSNSLMKLGVTVPPPWKSTVSPTITEDTVTKTIATLSIPDDTIFRTVTTDKVSKINDDVSSNNTNRVKEELTDTENMTQEKSVRNSSWVKATTPLSISTVITTSTSLPAVNSMEYFLNDESITGLTNDRGVKLENLDEDEIMEFSDFTDFKKGKIAATSTWISVPNEKIIPQSTNKEDHRDIESTLSIEHILNPTEHAKLTKDCTSEQGDDIENNSSNKEAIDANLQLIPISESSARDYNTFIEVKYQNDAPTEIHEVDGKRNTVKANTNINRASTILSSIEKEQTASPVYDENPSIESAVNRSKNENNYDHPLRNHQNSDKGYDEVVSEIEPEARAEIFELFASGSAGKRLERLLKSRNMSIEELIALRQRGSSKVHLTEVSRLKVPTPKNFQASNTMTSETTNTNDGKFIITLSPASGSNEHLNKDIDNKDAKQETIKSTSQFEKEIMSYIHDSLLNKSAKNVSISRLPDVIERNRNVSRQSLSSDNDTWNSDGYSELENSRRTMQIVDLLTTFNTLPFAKNIQRQFESDIDNNEHISSQTKLPGDNGNENTMLINEKEKAIGKDNSLNEPHAGYVEEIVRDEPNTIDIQRIYGETMDNTLIGEEKKTLSKVKPSIIASGAILGVTIVVFLAIFIICRIRQKQKYTYRNTFSRAVFQGPVLAARKLSNSSSLSAVMVNVVATSTTKRQEKTETQEVVEEFDSKSDIDNDSLDANDSWETIPDYAK